MRAPRPPRDVQVVEGRACAGRTVTRPEARRADPPRERQDRWT